MRTEEAITEEEFTKKRVELLKEKARYEFIPACSEKAAHSDEESGFCSRLDSRQVRTSQKWLNTARFGGYLRAHLGSVRLRQDEVCDEVRLRQDEVSSTA
jgi:hypothetical protein